MADQISEKTSDPVKKKKIGGRLKFEKENVFQDLEIFQHKEMWRFVSFVRTDFVTFILQTSLQTIWAKVLGHVSEFGCSVWGGGHYPRCT